MLLLLFKLIQISYKKENFSNLPNNLDKIIREETDGYGFKIKHNVNKLAIVQTNDLNGSHHWKYKHKFLTDRWGVTPEKFDFSKKSMTLIKESLLKIKNKINKKIIWLCLSFTVNKGSTDNEIIEHKQTWLLFYVDDDNVYILKNGGDPFEIRYNLTNGDIANESRYNRYIELFNYSENNSLSYELYDGDKRIKFLSNGKEFGDMRFDLVNINKYI